MPLFVPEDDDAIYLSRLDPTEPLSAFSKHAFFLDEHEWPSVAHYFHAMKFDDAEYQALIRAADHPKKAQKLGRSRRKKIRKDWSKVKKTVMTRAVYIKCKTHDDVAAKLLETGDRKIIENSNYDYYWGCGRDRRGENQFGQVLMSVRDKLREEQKEASA